MILFQGNALRNLEREKKEKKEESDQEKQQRIELEKKQILAAVTVLVRLLCIESSRFVFSSLSLDKKKKKKKKIYKKLSTEQRCLSR